MSRIRRRALIVALVLAGLSVLFPPWVQTFQHEGISQVRRPLGWAFVALPPDGRAGVLYGVEVDLPRLLLQLAVVLIGLGLVWIGSDDRRGEAPMGLRV